MNSQNPQPECGAYANSAIRTNWKQYRKWESNPQNVGEFESPAYSYSAIPAKKSALGGSRTHICLTHTRSLAGRICQFCYKGKMHPMGIEPIFHRKRSLNPLRLPVPPWAPNSGNRSRTCYLIGHEPRMVIRSTLPQGRQQGSNLRQADYKSAALPSELCRHILKNEIFKEHLRRGYESA